MSLSAVPQIRKSSVETVGIYTNSVGHFIEIVAYWVAFNSNLRVLVITQEHSKNPEHSWCLKRLSQSNFEIEVVSVAETPKATDWLYIYRSNSKLLFDQCLVNWVLRTKKIGILTGSSTGDGWSSKLKEFLQSLPYNLLASSIGFQASSQFKHPYFFIKNQFFWSPTVHPQFIVDSDYHAQMFAPVKESSDGRKLRFTFIGNSNPPERQAVLEQIKTWLNSITNCEISQEYKAGQEFQKAKVNVLWYVYGDQGVKRGLAPIHYVSALDQTDFCICPLGWGGNWTHRVIEALLRGAIPILEDWDRYNIGLTDMESCVAVKNQDWVEAIEKAQQCSSEKLFEMRSNIHQIREKHLLPEVASDNLRKAMGLK